MFRFSLLSHPLHKESVCIYDTTRKQKVQGIFVYGFRTSMLFLSLHPIGCFLRQKRSVKASSVKLSKRQTVKAVSVKCQSVKCQKNGFDSLTVANGRTRLKKQANTWFFQKSPYYSSVNCQTVNDCQNGGLTVNCKQIRRFRATVKLSRRSADKK